MGAPTIADVKYSMKRVWDTWGKFIPSALKSHRAEDIVIFASEPQWELAFTHTYVRVFRPANQFKEMPGKYIDFVLGFVTPKEDHGEKKIYLSPKTGALSQAAQRMILSHEYIHWLSHGAFYPNFYVIGGDNPFRVEGITQWLTLYCGYWEEFKQVPAYQAEFLKTDSWIGGSAKRQSAMLDFIFNGVSADLNTIKR